MTDLMFRKGTIVPRSICSAAYVSRPFAGPTAAGDRTSEQAADGDQDGRENRTAAPDAAGAALGTAEE